MPIVPNEAMKEIARRDPYVAAGYSVKWGRTTTKFDGCPCGVCKQRQPAGTKMVVLRSATGGIRAAVCPSCANLTPAAPDLGYAPAKSADTVINPKQVS